MDVVLVNDEEAREYTGEYSVFKAARAIRGLGPRIVIVKRGEYGAILASDGGYFFLPGYPLEDPRDPTGAGDSFAGGFLGYLASVDMTLPEAGGCGAGAASEHGQHSTRVGPRQCRGLVRSGGVQRRGPRRADAGAGTGTLS